MNIKWTENEKNFVKNNAYSMKDQEIANALGKTLYAVRKMRQRLSLRKESGRPCLRHDSEESGQLK